MVLHRAYCFYMIVLGALFYILTRYEVSSLTELHSIIGHSEDITAGQKTDRHTHKKKSFKFTVFFGAPSAKSKCEAFD